MKDFRSCISIFVQLISSAIFSQSTSWTSQPFDQKVFIENNGQFYLKNGTESGKILYGARSEGVDLYFKVNGLTYKHDESVPKAEEEKESIEKQTHHEEKEERNARKSTPLYLSIEWVGSNPNTQIISEDPVSFYYTYGGAGKDAISTIKSKAYKKIIYKNLYPNIDLEYVFPEDMAGAKYSLILHPGANLSDVKMKYINTNHISIDENGNIVIGSAFGTFVDHAPLSFYQKNNSKIKSSFILKGNEVTFKAADYNQDNTLIVDPWITNPAFTGFNSAYDMNYDINGNVYVYGSSNDFQLVKLNSSGVIQWIYNAIGINYEHYGDFALDEVIGTSYLIEGFSYNGAKVFKINTLGLQTGTFSGSFNFTEMWRAEYNRCMNKIVIAGGGINSTFQAAMLDTNLVNITPVNIISATQAYHDIGLLAIDNSSNSCFMATTRSNLEPNFADNILVKCPIPNLAPTMFSVSDGHKFVEGLSSVLSNTSRIAIGVNGMAVSPVWLYTYDSDSLKRWDKNTGDFISAIDVSPLIPTLGFLNQIVVPWSGLSVDECDNIYVGMGTSIKVYNTSLILINTIALPDTVYDVKLGLNNKLYACGRGFVTQIDIDPNNTTITVTQTPAISCSICDGTATVSSISCGNLLDYTYSWNTLPAQTTQTATGLCPGIYNVTVSTNCLNSFTGTVTVTSSNSTIAIAITTTNVNCNASGMATAAPSGGIAPYTYSWNNGQTTQTAIGLAAGTYTLIVTDSAGCNATQTATVSGFGSPLTLTTQASANSSCNANGTATATASGGTIPYTYLWNNGQTNQIATGLAEGTYTVAVTDANECSQIQIVIITGLDVPTVIAEALPSIITQGDNSQLTATGGGTYNWTPATGLSCSNCPNPIATPLETTNYCVSVTSTDGCTDSACVNVALDVISTVYIANAFTPNNNSLNDVFKPILLNVNEYKFLIFNRWGEKIFETSVIEEGWNGYYKGLICEQDTYVYKIVFKDNAKKDLHQYIGKVTLLR